MEFITYRSCRRHYSEICSSTIGTCQQRNYTGGTSAGCKYRLHSLQSSVPDHKPVSYTHLDVYKRQTIINHWARATPYHTRRSYFWCNGVPSTLTSSLLFSFLLRLSLDTPQNLGDDHQSLWEFLRFCLPSFIANYAFYDSTVNHVLSS